MTTPTPLKTRYLASPLWRLGIPYAQAVQVPALLALLKLGVKISEAGARRRGERVPAQETLPL